MKHKRYDKIIDEVYQYYLNTHKDELFILDEEMDLSKDKFIEKVKNNYSFGFLFGIQLNERKLTPSEIFNLINELETIKPTKLITLIYKGETIESYE
jgi:hypothetical protein